MRTLAEYIMRGRMQSVLVTTVFAVLALILPILGYVSSGAVALVALRRGWIEGALVAFVAVIVMAVLATYATGSADIAIAFALGIWLPVLFLAAVLRQSISLSRTLLVAAALSMGVVIVTHVMVPDIVAWWMDKLSRLRPMMVESGMFASADIDLMLPALAQAMTGLLAAAFLVSSLLGLLLGRWWQSLLYNPGGFRQEFTGLRLARREALAVVAVVAIAMLIGGRDSNLGQDLSIVILSLFTIPGMGVLHALVAVKRSLMPGLVVIYVLLLLVPQIVGLVALIGLADSWFDFRRMMPDTKKDKAVRRQDDESED